MHETRRGGASWLCLFGISLQIPTEVTSPNVADTTFNPQQQLLKRDVQTDRQTDGRAASPGVDGAGHGADVVRGLRGGAAGDQGVVVVLLGKGDGRVLEKHAEKPFV